tara:strand:+ start:2718 stop:2930 length:213 start_codon:yes stop_codon:yes gene_type:complete
MKYVGYDFNVDKYGKITFDEELNAERFLSLNGFRDGQVCMLRNVDGRLVLVCTDYIEDNPAQTVLPFDEL